MITVKKKKLRFLKKREQGGPKVGGPKVASQHSAKKEQAL
jgi:hypothetical protein